MALPSPFKGYHHATYPAIDPSRPELSLKGKNVIVTGGGGTIGSAMVGAFAQAGVNLIGIVGRNQKTLDSTKAKHATQYPGVNLVTATADITDPTSLEAAFTQIRDTAKGPIDILISNAGYLARPATIMESEPREWWTAFEINAKGSFNTLRAFHAVAVTPQAVIVNLTSGAAQVANPAWSAYSASKLAGIRVFQTFQVENPDFHVVSIQPGIIQSDMSDKAGPGITPQDSADLPASFAVWLCSPEARFLKNKFVWANWDVDEMKARANQIQNSPLFTMGLAGWPVLPDEPASG